jgi:predicted ATP-dependent protease
MTAEKQARELGPDEIDFVLDPAVLGFESTAELEPLDEILGQPRALKALDLGLGIRHHTYNIYVAGLNGTGQKETITKVLNERMADKAVPSDWVYVHNFIEADRPIAVDLPPGKGNQFQQDMDKLVRKFQDELPKTFRREDFILERKRVGQDYEKQTRAVIEELEALAKEKGLSVQQMSEGEVTLVPIKDEHPISQEEFESLSDEQRQELARRQQEAAEKMESVMAQGRELRRQLGADMHKVERDFAARIIDPRIGEIRQRYPHEKIAPWLDKLREHLLDHMDRFMPGGGGPEQKVVQLLRAPGQTGGQEFVEYRVNVIVDNSGLNYAPVIIEETPNYKNLFGTTGGVVDRFGRITGDFTHIRAGSLLRANGGYLVLDLLEALAEPLVWKELKHSIKSGKMEFHAYDPLGIFTAAAIRPDAIPLNVKLVVLGSPLVYHLLHLYDDDFSDIFKVKADFATDMDLKKDIGLNLGRFVQKIVQQEGECSFNASGVAELVRTAVRIAGNREKVTTEFSRLADIIRESCYWSRQDRKSRVDAVHVRKAVDEKVYRSDLIAARIRELIRDGTLLISLEGSTVGQVNGLGVINLGDYLFGKPSRLTASVGVGAAGVINIERESKLSGQTYDKAMLILDGYLRNTYAKEHPLALSAGIAMEQSYNLVEGDSASVAEMCCLLSSIARIPLRQDIAVTGSVNQWGGVQAVGGVNEKIEGFFDVCRESGLTGRQGVCIPASNVRNLVLRPDVIHALRSGEFHIWAVERIDEALQLLSGLPAGTPEEDGTFHYQVDRQLRDMAAALKEQKAVQGEVPGVLLPPAETVQRDPRPALPGRK